jgi:putative endonuclease|tara:strand:+ start:570 stop:959 length:390 start_codon:yes stop_codon:yes gene_type:complete
MVLKQLLSNKAINTVKKGLLTEQFAKEYLQRKGLVFIANNFYCRRGELDLIMRDGDTLVFIEVKYRKGSHFGGAIAAITPSKINKIKQSIVFYLHQAGLNEYHTPCRIDVITLQGNINHPHVNWLKNAI